MSKAKAEILYNYLIEKDFNCESVGVKTYNKKSLQYMHISAMVLNLL